MKNNTVLFLFSILLVSLVSFNHYSNDVLGNAFAQTDVDVGVDTETKVNIGGKSDDEQSNVSVEEKSETTAEVKTQTSTETKSEEKSSETTSETKTESQTQLTIKSSYPKIKASSENSFIIQSEQMLYQPGENIHVEGTLFSGLLMQLGADNTVNVQIFDTKGTLVKENTVQMKSDGNFSAEVLLPLNTVYGEYTIKSKIISNPSVLDTLSAETRANLESTTKIIVSIPSSVKIKVEGHDDFDVKIASNSNISDIEFKESEKMISFMVEGESGTKGVTQVSIPKALLSGQMSVMIDGEIMADDDVIVTSNTETTTTLELNYHHSVHQIDVVGTNAVPEFGSLPLIMLIIAISGIILVSSKYGHIGIKTI